MYIAIPTAAPGGLDAPVADHFGHCDAFTLVRMEDGKLGEVNVVPNGGHEQGGCMAPVRMLKEHGVDALIAGGMGMRPLAGFRSVGIKVFFKGDARTARDAAEQMAAGQCKEFGQDQTCGGGSGGCGSHHHHEPIVREPIEGVADVRANRVVTMHFTLRQADGTAVDSTAPEEPVRYLHGHGEILPGLERALAGLEAGARKTVELAAADAFGERDDAKIIEVPRDRLPEGVSAGATLQGQLPDGRMAALRVDSLDESVARLDANHPLAGVDLVFEVTIECVEAATADEIAAGRVLG